MRQEELATAAGMSAQSISAIINGRENIRTDSAIALANVLNVSIDYLLLGKPSEHDTDGLHQLISGLNSQQYHCLQDIIIRFCQALRVVNTEKGCDESLEASESVHTAWREYRLHPTRHPDILVCEPCIDPVG